MLLLRLLESYPLYPFKTRFQTANIQGKVFSYLYIPMFIFILLMFIIFVMENQSNKIRLLLFPYRNSLYFSLFYSITLNKAISLFSNTFGSKNFKVCIF